MSPFAPEAEDLDEDFLPARRVRELEVRHPDAVRERDRVRVGREHPALHLRREAVGEHLQFRRRVDAEVGEVRAQTVRGRQGELLLLALRAPANARLQVERLAVQERGQEERQLQAVLLRRGEERQRAVELERVASRRRVAWMVQMRRWNLTARNSCRKRAGVSPQTRTSIAVQRSRIAWASATL